MQENSQNLNAQAVELASQGLYKEAIACFKRAVIIDKNNYLLWYNLGITYRDSGHPKDAKNALLQAYKLNDIDEELLEKIKNKNIILWGTTIEKNLVQFMAFIKV